MNNFKNIFNNETKFIGLGIILILFIWLISGFYVINQNEQGVITRFGKYVRSVGPGLHLKFQYPFERLYKVQTTTVHKIEIGSRDGVSSKNQNNTNILTGDENIVDVNFEIQWRIKDPQKFLFNLNNQIQTIIFTAESVMNEVVGRTKISVILSSGRSKIEQDVKTMTQEILDSYNSGIEIVLIQMLRADPPLQVIDSFRDVQTAKADKERKINQAQAYQNSIIPKTQGEVDKIIQEALAYKSVVIANAEGQSKRFLDVYNEYLKSKEITKKRIYIETMEQIMNNNDIVILEKSSTNLLPYFDVNAKQKNEKQVSSSN